MWKERACTLGGPGVPEVAGWCREYEWGDQARRWIGRKGQGSAGSVVRSDGRRQLDEQHQLAQRQSAGEWYGVTTDANGRVTGLNLFRNRLSGELPSLLGDLTYLESLGLYDNRLSGSLPSSLGNLTNLTSLDLGETDFSGSLPSSLGNLTKLKMAVA